MTIKYWTDGHDFENVSSWTESVMSCTARLADDKADGADAKQSMKDLKAANVAAENAVWDAFRAEYDWARGKLADGVREYAGILAPYGTVSTQDGHIVRRHDMRRVNFTLAALVSDGTRKGDDLTQIVLLKARDAVLDAVAANMAPTGAENTQDYEGAILPHGYSVGKLQRTLNDCIKPFGLFISKYWTRLLVEDASTISGRVSTEKRPHNLTACRWASKDGTLTDFDVAFTRALVCSVRGEKLETGRK